jgi:hypothetical protein
MVPPMGPAEADFWLVGEGWGNFGWRQIERLSLDGGVGRDVGRNGIPALLQERASARMVAATPPIVFLRCGRRPK